MPLQFIIGDVEGGDQLSSRFSYRGKSCQRLCRTCDVSTENASDVNVLCSRIKVVDVIAIVASQDNKALRLLAQRPRLSPAVCNAWMSQAPWANF